jgi:signal transduction histidine kinase
MIERQPTTASLQTRFAPAARSSDEEIAATVALIAQNPLVTSLLDAANMLVVVVNARRQIIYANTEFHAAADNGSAALEGFRPGEVLGCVNAWESPAGCGTAEPCASCGVVGAFLGAERTGQPRTTECLLTLRHGRTIEAREFECKATPVVIGGTRLTVLSMRDVSHEKRRQMLEHVFFHDVLNTITGLRGYAQLLQSDDGDLRPLIERVAFLSERLQREVHDQSALLSAESGELQLELAPVRAAALVDAAAAILAGHAQAAGKTLEVQPADGALELVTDAALMTRVLTNMVKNAFEATPSGGTVRVWLEAHESGCTFSVWNAGVIPAEIARQIFKRSFSTKAKRGRGLGTYSMKLFGERHLGGRVYFTTGADGTTFSIFLPPATPRAGTP